jgi:hypothetical protein
VTSAIPRKLESIAAFVLFSIGLLGIASCGGSVSPSTDVSDPSKITILPGTATMYSGLPTTFSITGGTGLYIVASSNQAVIQLAGSIVGGSLTVIANNVSSDTPVTLTVRDTGTSAPVSANVTVKPGTVSNNISIIPTSTQAAACGAALCSGGDAEVRVVVSQGGIPLAARGVRLDVVSGDFRVIVSAAGVSPEVTAISGTTTTDETGTARMRIRVLADAPAQTALLQISDLGSGAYQRTSFTVAPSSNSPLNAQPRTLSFIGPDNSKCANGIVADVIVFGGRPPYSISQPGTFNVDPLTVTSIGGRFSVTAIGQCASGSIISIVDSIGGTVSVTASNALQTSNSFSASPLVVAPTTVSLDSCSTVASVVVAGGLGGPYFATSGNSGVSVSVVSGVVSIQRKAGTGPIAPTSVPVAISDGKSVLPVTVNLVGAGAGAC